MAKVADITAQGLRDLGVRFVFGVPSGNWIDFMEGIRRTDGIDFVLVANESAAGFMADVCWRLTGKPSACFGTYGPGACNLSTGVCGGYLDRSPMFVFADEMPDDKLDRIVQMNIDNRALFSPITKWRERLRSDGVRSRLYHSFRIAVSEVPGPVYIGLPTGLGAVACSDRPLPLPVPEAPIAPLESELEHMTGLFLKSTKPVLALGITALRFELEGRVAALAEKFRIPVVLTPMAKGLISEDHPAYAGVLAHALADRVGRIHQQADLVIGLGYDPVEINYEDWMPSVPLLHIDTRQADVDRKQVDLAGEVLGDIRASLEYLIRLPGEPKNWDFEELTSHKEEMFRDLQPSAEGFDARAILADLREFLPRNGIMTCDVGAHLHLIGQAWKTYSPTNQLMTNGCSSMGFGVPAAIAAKLCCPERDVVCITGDGGFLMMAGEIATARRLNAKVVFVVISDQDLSLIRIKQERKSYPRYGTRLHETPPSSAPSLFGVPQKSARSRSEFQEALEFARSVPGPVVIEAVVEKTGYENFILRGNR